MAGARAADLPRNYGLLTEEGIARLKLRIGVQYNQPRPPHNREVTWDGSRQFALGYGDDNPLWCDPDYGAGTRWGTLIAPPNFMYTIGDLDAKPSPQEKELLKGDPLAGLGVYQSAMDIEWWRPMRRGDRILKRAALVGVDVNEKSTFSGRTVAEHTTFFFRNFDEEVTCVQRGVWTRAERHESAARKKETKLPVPYSANELAAIDAAYEAETIRGATKRYWEDIVVGETIPTIVRGPLRVSDLIAFHIGWGMQVTPPGAFRMSYKVRKKAPGLYTPNSLNVPDTVQRLHWETEWANKLGIPLSYDYGGLRETFMTNIATNWMGDDGWLWKLRCEHRKFVYIGDTYWITGKIVDKRQFGDRNEVHLELSVANQWGATVSPGSAVVLLPTRQSPVTLPRPAEERIDALVAHEVKTHVGAERK
jgi:acyl dehydratase